MGYNERGFFPLWDTTEEFFSAVGYNREGFPTLWDTTEEDFFCCGIQRRTISGWQTNFVLLYFSSVVSYTLTESCAVYCIPEKSSALYPATPQFFFYCISQWKIFSSVVGYNGRGFFSCGIQRKKLSSIVGYNRSFFPLWDTMEKKHTTQNDTFKF